MAKEIGIGLLGLGGVNRALVELIHKNRQVENEIRLKVVGVSDMFLGTATDPDGLDLDLLLTLPNARGALSVIGQETPDNDAVIAMDGCDIVAEATFSNMEDGEPALSLCRSALSQGKHVTTTNKGSVAFGAQSLSTLAAEKGVSFLYEGSVMSGTPVLSWAKACFPGVQIREVRGILNGTTNYILGQLERGLDFDTALKDAQAKGFAEADPTSDISGHDVRAKVMILAQALYGRRLGKADIDCSGISNISAEDMTSAKAQNKRWKLVARIESKGDELVATVAPTMVAEDDPLYGINGATNALSITTDPLGPSMVSGPGAGRLETAYALYADILKIADTLERAA